MYFSAMYRLRWYRKAFLGWGRQTTVRWQIQLFIHTRLSRAYLALAIGFLVILYLLYNYNSHVLSLTQPPSLLCESVRNYAGEIEHANWICRCEIYM